MEPGYENEPTSKRRRIGSEAGSSSLPSALAEPGGGYEYDVFLSFRGEETRKTFTDCLHSRLVGAGIRVFRDTERVGVGEEIGPELRRGIEQSQISIPIFSMNYAFSKWCLQELALMMKCRETRKQVILPVFYDVKPSQVRHQTGDYHIAFQQHKEKQDPTNVQEWREALAQVGSLRGWELANEANGHQGQLIEKIITRVLRELKTAHLVVTNELVGVEDQVEAVMRMLEVGVPDVRFIGIWGMGGIGKTTLAKVIYNQIRDQFESWSFLQDVREASSKGRGGIRCLQSQLVADLLRCKPWDFATTDEGVSELQRRFRDKVVLVLLDDVDDEDQLNALAANFDWFARGSRIIVTTRNRDILKGPLGYRVYQVRELEGDQALRLFCRHALRKDAPPTDKLDALSREIVQRTGGLPLALEVIGSFLCGKREDIWKATSQKLKIIPNKKVADKLRISYDGLEHDQKQVFLDIACLFIGEDKRDVSYMWEDCFQYSPEATIEVLLLASLIKIGDNNKLRMHDQLRDLGREIVRQENLNEPGQRSRLWDIEAVEVLEMHQGSSKIEAIDLIVETRMEDYCFAPEHFRDLSNLRSLQLEGAYLAGDFRSLLPKMRWLKCRISSTDDTATNLDLKNLVVLNLSCSRLAHDWTAWNSNQIAAVKLRVLHLDFCIGLTRTPDFSKFQNLERLSLGYCSSLGVVDPSIGKLKRLTSLNMEGCEKIEELPQQFDYLKSLRELAVDWTSIKELPALGNMKRLEILSAKWCRYLDKLPDSIGLMTSLSDLVLEGTGIAELPGSIGSLVNLRRLTLANTPLSELPISMGGLKSLIELVLSETRVASLPVSIGNLNNLEVLKIDQTKVRCLPAALGELERLRVLDASECPLCEEIPVELGRLSLLKVLLLRGTKISAIPETIKGLPLLEVLEVAHCDQLTILPELPTSLVEVSVTCRSTAPIPNLSDLINLKKLEFIQSTVPEDIMQLPKLEKLHISSTTCSFIQNGIDMLSMLKELSLDEIDLPCLPKLPCGLHKLSILHCAFLERLADLSNLQSLSYLRLEGCRRLVEIKGLGSLLSLRSFTIFQCEAIHNLDGLDELEKMFMLDISGCNIIERLSMSGLKLLDRVNVWWCQKLEGLDGLDELENLRYLNIGHCKSIERLPDLSNLKFLRYLLAYGCEKLKGLDGLDKLEALVELHISGCKAIQRLPDLSSLRLLEILSADGCENLQELEGLENLKRLKRLNASGCVAIENLPNLSKLKKLTRLDVSGCKMLREIQGLEELELIEEINIDGCNLLQKLPDLPNARIIEDSLEVQLRREQHDRIKRLFASLDEESDGLDNSSHELEQQDDLDDSSDDESNDPDLDDASDGASYNLGNPSDEE